MLIVFSFFGKRIAILWKVFVLNLKQVCTFWVKSRSGPHCLIMEQKKMFFNLLLTCWGQYRVDGGAGGIFRVPGPEVAASCPVALNRAGIPAVHVLHGCVGSQRLQSNASFGTIVWNKRRHCLNISLVVYYGPLFFVQRTIPAVHFS